MHTKKIMIFANHDVVIYNFRKELVMALIDLGHEVYLVCPYGERLVPLIDKGALHIDTSLERHGINPIKEYVLFRHYRKIIQKVQPDLIMSNTIKHNLYTSKIAKDLNIPYVISVTGMGTIGHSRSIVSMLFRKLFSRYYKDALAIVVENNTIFDYFTRHVSHSNVVLVGGSGVNLEEYKLEQATSRNNDEIHIGFIARIMKAKGINEFLNVTQRIKDEYKDVVFHVAGFIDGPYEDNIRDFNQRGIIQYHGFLPHSKSLLKALDAVVLPSYHEGLSNILLEAAAMQKVIIASNIPGCQETFIDGITGYACEPRDEESLYQAIVKLIHTDRAKRNAMGLKAREHVKQFFNRENITQTYISFLDKI